MIGRFIGAFILFHIGIANGAFLPQTNDIPLMDGIILTETEHFSFDTPAGQILTFEGNMKNDISFVRTFYDKTLASLGWQKNKTDFYVRGNDTLELSFIGENKIRFEILLSSD